MEPMGSDVELRIFWGGGDGLGIFKIRPPPPQAVTVFPLSIGEGLLVLGRV